MKTSLKIAGGALATLVIASGSTWLWASAKTQAALARRLPVVELEVGDTVRAAQVELGARIVTVRNGCVDCHGQDLGGGRVVDNPLLGRIWAPNITPARLAGWTDGAIARAVSRGVAPDGRPLLVMPSFEYSHLSQGDVAAVVAYLRSVPRVERDVPAQRIGPLGAVLYATGKLPLFAADQIAQDAAFRDKPDEAPTAEFGRYLATSACIGCHGAEFRGGPIPGGAPEWAPAASLRLGADPRWSAQAFAATMRDGRSAIDGHALRAPMPVALARQMSETEVGALWQYLSTLN